MLYANTTQGLKHLGVLVFSVVLGPTPMGSIEHLSVHESKGHSQPLISDTAPTEEHSHSGIYPALNF